MHSNYRQLVAWQRALALATSMYDITEGFPPAHRFTLADQIRRAASSVPANIAEGFGRWTRKDCRRFLLNARGSLFELESHLELSHQVGLVDREKLDLVLEQLADVVRPLSGLIKRFEE